MSIFFFFFEMPIFLRKINIACGFNDLNFRRFVTFILTCLLKHIKIILNEYLRIFFPLIYILTSFSYLSSVDLSLTRMPLGVCRTLHKQIFLTQSISSSNLSCKGEGKDRF